MKNLSSSAKLSAKMRAFTLIEFLVILAAISVIAALVIPAVSAIDQENSGQVKMDPKRFNIENIKYGYELVTDNQTGRQYLSQRRGGFVEVGSTN